MNRFKRLLGGLAVSCTLAAPGARAADFPAKPVTIIVPFAAGGPVDIVARSVAVPMADVLKRPVIVENDAGAAGIVGSVKAMRATPDGYTLLLGHAGTHAFNAALNPALQYRPIEDFKTVAMLANMPSILNVSAGSRFKDVKELLTYARANPKKLNFGSAGSGSASHLAAMMLIDATKIEVTFVSYRGSNPAFTDLISGQLDALFDTSAQAVPQVLGKRVRALAVTSDQRLPALPGTVTLAESCCKNLSLEIWYGLFAPRNTPDNILQTLEAAALASIGDPRYRATMQKANVRVPELAKAGRQEFEAVIRRDLVRFGDLAKRTEAKVE